MRESTHYHEGNTYAISLKLIGSILFTAHVTLHYKTIPLVFSLNSQCNHGNNEKIRT